LGVDVELFLPWSKVKKSPAFAGLLWALTCNARTQIHQKQKASQGETFVGADAKRSNPDSPKTKSLTG